MLSVLEEVIPRSEADRCALIRAHYALQSGSFLSECDLRDCGIVAASTATPIPMWNHAAWIEGSANSFAAFLADAGEWLSARSRRPVVYVSEEQGAEQETLKAIGFDKFDEEAWMTYSPPDSPELEMDNAVRIVSTDKEFNDFLSAFHAAYQTRGDSYGGALKGSGAKEIEHYALISHERPVCIGTLIHRNGLACIYNLGTPPAERKKGYAQRLMKHITARALSLGCGTIMLQVENKSGAMRLYEKLGFRTRMVRVGYRLSTWTAPQTTRTQLAALLGYKPSVPSASRHLRESRPLDSTLTGAIAGFLRKTGITPEVLWMGAWASLVHGYSGEESVEFAGLSDHHEARLNRVSFEPNTKIIEWLRNRVGDATVAGDPSGQEVLLRFPKEPLSHFAPASFPLEISIVGGQAVEIQFRSDLFSKDSIRRMASHLVNAVESITRDPEGVAGNIEILSSREKHQLLVEWNSSDFTLTGESLQQMFESQVERTPDSTSLVFARARVRGAVEEMTYRQLNRKANKLAHRLKKAGVGPNVYVGVCLHRSLDIIVSLLAIFKAGGACVPLDPAYPVDRIIYMVQDTKAPVILTESALLPSLKDHTRSQLICLDKEWSQIQVESDKNPSVNAAPSDPAYVIYTSGSTGRPKGVVISRHAIANHSADCKRHYGLNPKDKILQFSSFNFDASFEQILPALISGAALIVRDEEIWTTREFAEKLRDLQLTVADIPTAYWHELVDEWNTNPSAVPSHNLRLVIVGGEALSLDKLKLWLKSPLGKVRLINAYGPTEATITATSYEVPRVGTGEGEPSVLPIGRPRGDRKAYILDSVGNPVPIGIPGELHIGGSLLATGYHGRPELTAQKFIQNPFSDEAASRLYRTGDLVRYLEDGNIEFLGRIDDQVKIRGFRIELGEVESSLLKHPAVKEAMVLARPDSSGEKRLVGYVVSHSQAPDPRELKEHLKTFLPHYMVPSRIVALENWPLLPNGKVDRRALPEPEDDQPTGGLAGPRDPLELQLQLIFERVLKRASIAIDVSFFELGGDSLQALELLVEIEKATGKSLPMGTLYQSSTVETLAREIQDRSSDADWSSLVPLQKSGNRPPLFLLHTTPGDILGYGNLVYRLGSDQPCHGFQSLGLKESRLSHTRVEEMAEYYVNLLREFQPNGPYYLGGWCYGGIVAVEMARILKAQGETIALLALLETVALPPAFSNYNYYLHRIRCTFRMGWKRWRAYVREKAKYARDSRLANRMRFREAIGDRDVDLNQVDPRLAKLEFVYNTNLAALKHYRTNYYDGKVTLFNAAEKDPALIPDPCYGWVGLAREIEVHEVPGNHDTMLTEPNVSVLAANLQRCLQSAQQQSKTSPK